MLIEMIRCQSISDPCSTFDVCLCSTLITQLYSSPVGICMLRLHLISNCLSRNRLPSREALGSEYRGCAGVDGAVNAKKFRE